MRKRRRLSNKMTIMVCAVLLAVSAFFYAPMNVSAEESNSNSFSQSGSYYPAPEQANTPVALSNSIDLVSSSQVDDNTLYEVNIVYNGVLNINRASYVRYNIFHYGDSELYSREHITFDDLTSHTLNFTNTIYLYGSDLYGKEFVYESVIITNTDSVVLVSYSLNSNISVSVSPVSTSDSEDYQNGYNAGYSAGESAGYGNGYSQGFTDGEASVDTDAIYDKAFQDGKDSVDTQTYYDAGYQAGYQVAYSEGYESGYDVGYQSAMDRIANWGADTADYPVTVYENSFSNLKVLCDINTNIPQISYGNFYFPQFNFAVNPNHTYKVVFNSSTYTKASAHASGSQSDNIVYNLGSLELPWYIGESYAFIPGSRFTSNVRLDCYIYGAVYDDGSNSSNFETWSAQYVLTFKSIDIKVYDMGPSGDTQNHIANQTDQLTNGYDDSKGNQVNSDLSTGLNDYETAENSLFATATTGMRDFTFFDFESVPAMITGISFIGSIMGSWFNQAGGASGVGIVLSILFSVILVAMVLGLYRWYQSRGGKN